MSVPTIIHAGTETEMHYQKPVSVTTSIEDGWTALILAPRGLIGTATDDVMDDLVGPKASDQPLTGWSRSVVEDPIRGPKDPGFVRWLRELRIRQ